MKRFGVQNSPTRTRTGIHAAAVICSYLVTRWEDSRIIPSSPLWISMSALDLTPEKKMINSLRNVLAPELNLLLITTLHVSSHTKNKIRSKFLKLFQTKDHKNSMKNFPPKQQKQTATKAQPYSSKIVSVAILRNDTALSDDEWRNVWLQAEELRKGGLHCWRVTIQQNGWFK